MTFRRTIIAIQGARGTDFGPALPYLERAGTVELGPGAVIYLDLGSEHGERKLRRKLLLLRSTIQALLNVTIRIGASTRKSVSLVAARQSVPGGLTIVRAGDESSFLDRVAIDLLPGIGRRTATYLRNRGVTTIGRFAKLPQTAAVQLFGVSGIILREFSRGADPRDVISTTRPSPPLRGRQSLFSFLSASARYSTLGVGLDTSSR